MMTVVVGSDIEKLKGEFESEINGMNMVGEISYSNYSRLFDVGTKAIQEAYELGLKNRNCLDCSNRGVGIKYRIIKGLLKKILELPLIHDERLEIWKEIEKLIKE